MSPAAIRTGADRTLELLAQQVGRSLGEVETPVAVVDLGRLEANLGDLQSYADAHAIALWPHTKTHKSPEIGLRQLELGAAGLTVAKTGEAEVFHEAGAPRLLVHYPPFGQRQVGTSRADRRRSRADRRGGRLPSGRGSRRPPWRGVGPVRACSSSSTSVSTAPARRPPPERSRLHSALSRLPAVEVAGISCYPGHCRGDAETVRERVMAVDELLQETRDAFAAAGIRNDRISGGSTPSRYLTHETCVNELRSGTYALLDRVDGGDLEAVR